MLNWKTGLISYELFYTAGFVGISIATGWGNFSARFNHAVIDVDLFS
jgi:hypothetical protein